VVTAGIHTLVDPMFERDRAKARRGCATAVFVKDRRYAEAIVALAEDPRAERTLGPLAACVGEAHGLLPRVTKIATDHP
ncbi:hypothetical protein, partial [Staphylococcus aureus]|uniref:hypothetical protein n=1 Tax=Staphylococcus aureus TaxID=1280 RepID=UPI0021B13E16